MLRRRARRRLAKAAPKAFACFKLAGRPSQQDFVKVYGPNGPKMTWEQRAKAGVPAEKFQAALAAKQVGAVRQMARQVFTFDAPPGREMCDFCSASPTARLYACRNFIIPRTKHAVFQHESIGAWSACDRCAVLIDAGHWSQLTDRALRRFCKQVRRPEGRVGAKCESSWREIHQLFKEHMIKEV